MSSDPIDRPVPAPAAPVALDAAALARLAELDPDGRHGVVSRVLGAFETSLARMLVQLAAEREQGDAGVVAGIAHTLKSASASVGALALAETCREVEDRLRQRGSGGVAGRELAVDVERLLAQGHAALDAVRAMLRH